MKILILTPFFFFISCGNNQSKTTETSSNKFKTLKSKIEFLEKYVTFKRQYKEINYHISFHDGGDGLVPSPTEYNLGIYAVVPEKAIGDWHKGLTQTEKPKNLNWLKTIPNTSQLDLSKFKWYKEKLKYVGISKNEVLYYTWRY